MMKALVVAALAATLLGAPGSGTLQQHTTPQSVEFTLHLDGSLDSAFPLFDPVNEKRWDPHWNPRLLAPHIEEGLVFLVGEGDSQTTWLVDRYDPQQHHIAYVAVSRSVLTRIAIQLVPAAHGCEASVRYIKTPLELGAQHGVDDFAMHFPQQREHWESAINAVLRGSPH